MEYFSERLNSLTSRILIHQRQQQNTDKQASQANATTSSQSAAMPAAPENSISPEPNLGLQTVGGLEREGSEHLYRVDGWTRLWFPRLMLLALVRLLVFVRKIYEDQQGTVFHAAKQSTAQFLISVSTLVLPTIVYTIYRVTHYLQTELSRRSSANSPSKIRALNEARALLASPVSIDTVSKLDQEDGLVTARQTPIPTEEVFHDSKSIQDLGSTQNLPQTPAIQASSRRASPSPQPIESVNIDKLGDLPDKTNTRLVIGISEQLLHGLLFVFWLLKHQVDRLGYLVERSCLWRKPRDQERETLDHLSTSSDGLEWFQDFYAAFLAIVAQVYVIASQYKSNNNSNAGLQLKEDQMIFNQILVSCAVVVSLLIAVRRLDDGPLTLGLSMLGWGSLFSARIIIIALTFVYLNWKISLAIILGHVLLIAAWIYRIALDSHNNKHHESMEHKWGKRVDQTIPDEPKVVEVNTKQLHNTSQWSFWQHLALQIQILNLFALPSIFYWPIMFNLNLHSRPLKYLVLVMSENFIMIPLIWFTITSANTTTPHQWYLLVASGILSIAGFLFISLYICCKPDLTDCVTRFEELYEGANRAGIYYEFCSRVFKMPDLNQQSFRMLVDQNELQNVE